MRLEHKGNGEKDVQNRKKQETESMAVLLSARQSGKLNGFRRGCAAHAGYIKCFMP
jgi:hypothetical protein